MRASETRQIQIAVGWIAIMAFGPLAAFAHQGPPFPILMDQPLAGYVVSVWADPDIGDAQFYIIVEAPEGGRPADVPQVEMWVEPIDGRLDRVSYETTRQPVRNQVEFAARPYFDQRDQWTVGFQVTAPGGETQELTTEVESTPPGYGPVDFVIYLFPFVFLGGFWMVAMVRRNRLRREMLLEETNAASASADTKATSHAVDFRKDANA